MKKQKSIEKKEYKPAPIQKESLSDSLKENFMTYAMYVIISRAIPAIDGFKPSHRKVLYTMYRQGLLDGPKTKSSNIIGEAMKLHPHGDETIYETMVRMTSGYEALTLPYIESKGNMGKSYSSSIKTSAHRYTEAKLAPVAAELFRGIKKNAVDMLDNYDNKLKEPVLLPVSFPSILVNSNIGIAVGMNCEIPSFHLKEVCDGTILFLQGKDPKEAFSYPDFPTGEEVAFNPQEVNQIFETGTGKYKLRGKYQISEKERYIQITNIPYTTTVEKIVSEIVSRIKKGKISEIADVRRETDKDGLKIGIDYKKGVDPKTLMQKLFYYTSLEDTMHCKIRVLLNGQARVVGIYELLEEWKKWRIDTLRRELVFEKEEITEKISFLEALLRISVNIEKAIKIIKDSTEDEMIQKLQKAFSLTEKQAEYVADIRLRNINHSYIEKRTKDLESLKQEVDTLEKDIADDKRIIRRIIAQLKEISKKYGADRKTEIVNFDPAEKVVEPENPENDLPFYIFLTKDGYLKKIKPDKISSIEEVLQEKEYLQGEYVEENGEILIFMSNQIAIKKKFSEIPWVNKITDRGEYIGIFGEDVIKMILLSRKEKFPLIFIYENGRIAKTDISSYKINRKKIEKAYAPFKIFDIFYAKPNTVIQISDQKKELCIAEKSILCKNSRVNQGSIYLKKPPIQSASCFKR